ncbi:hypothetical protein HOP50_05g36060 [Chloropicon primus]|uniref:Transmembrane protein n=1 Tax=Chloropicon primus TaxID=1764295 RepID=A0A5B8MP25_9CHLO|nr:hypothetical protein A3770_05p35980 [Chloropicon primus]UPR00292.1 hypothetical protein HOP50_05g36060 [Chloropicon primus]|eukprot:QDZ21080.1 hypothetical protein A3770_05p35980 [Chloropicon primus]
MPSRARTGVRRLLSLKRIFALLVTSCFALVAFNFLYNHPIHFEVRVVGNPGSNVVPGSQNSEAAQVGGDVAKNDDQGVAVEESKPPPPMETPPIALEEDWSPTRYKKSPSYASVARRLRRGDGLGRGKKERAKQRQQHRHHHTHIAESWAKLLIKTSFSADVDAVCSGVNISMKEEGSKIPAEVLSQIKSCVRAVIAHCVPYDRESLTGSRIQSQVASKAANLEAASLPELKEIVFEELSHVQTSDLERSDQMLKAAQAILLAERKRRGEAIPSFTRREQRRRV